MWTGFDRSINEEATRYLKLYLDERRRGTRKIPPETITDDSPLFSVPRVVRSSESPAELKVRPLTYGGVFGTLRKIFSIVGLCEKRGRYYEVRIHSIRKFFRTQQEALGMTRDYVEYMMGHKLSTYNDVTMKGVEFLRGVYASANLRVFPESKTSLTDVLKEMIRAHGEDPEKYLKSEVIPDIDIITPADETEAYAMAILKILRKDVLNELLSAPELRKRF